MSSWCSVCVWFFVEVTSVAGRHWRCFRMIDSYWLTGWLEVTILPGLFFGKRVSKVSVLNLCGVDDLFFKMFLKRFVLAEILWNCFVKSVYTVNSVKSVNSVNSVKSVANYYKLHRGHVHFYFWNVNSSRKINPIIPACVVFPPHLLILKNSTPHPRPREGAVCLL